MVNEVPVSVDPVVLEMLPCGNLNLHHQNRRRRLFCELVRTRMRLRPSAQPKDHDSKRHRRQQPGFDKLQRLQESGHTDYSIEF